MVITLFGTPAYADWPIDPTVNLPVCTAASSQDGAHLVSDGAGGALIAWQDFRSGQGDIFAQHVLSSGQVDPTWPDGGLALCTAPTDQTDPRIVSDGAGGAIVSWCDKRNGARALYAQRVLAGGSVDISWPTDGRAIADSIYTEYDHTIVSDGANGAILAWPSSGSRANTILAQRILASGNVDPSWPGPGLVVNLAPLGGWSVAMISDGSGGAILTWMDVRNVHADIYAQHVLPGGTRDPGWPAGGSLLCGNDQNKFTPAVATDGAGGAIVAWRDLRSATGYQAYAQHVRADGVVDPAWAPDGRLLSLGSKSLLDIRIVSDGAGGAIVAWSDDRGDSTNVYAQRVLASGALHSQWPSSGLAIAPMPGYQRLGDIVHDGQSGAVVGWYDFRSGAFDIFAQHVSADGAINLAWPSSGAPVTIATNGQSLGQGGMIPDGLGGAIMAWGDDRSGGPLTRDIYAQRVDASGIVGGTVSVLPSTSATPNVVCAWPNPAHSAEINLSVVLPRDGTARVEVFDVFGRKVGNHDLEAHSSGRHTVKVPLDRALPSGTYLVLLTQGSEKQIARVAVLR